MAQVCVSLSSLPPCLLYRVLQVLCNQNRRVCVIRFHEDIAPLIDGFGHASMCAVPTNYCNDLQQIDACYEDWLLDGYEGMMIRLDLPYEQKRSSTLMKRKEFQDAEFEIVRIEEGVGNAAGMAKIAYMRLLDGKVFTSGPAEGKDTFKADIVGTRDELRDLLKKAKTVIGKQATIEFQNYTPAGVPRFPKLKVIHHTERW
jgi:DNA ligase-1